MRRFGKWLGRLLLLAAAGLAAFLIFAPAYVERQQNQVVEHAPYPISDAARALHDSLIIGDWHADSTLWNRDLTERGNRGHVDIPRLIEGNVALQVFTSVTKSPRGQSYDSNSADAPDNITPLAMGQLWPPRTWGSLFERAIYQAERLQGFAEDAPERFMIIRSRADLETLLERRAAGEAVVGGLLGIEGAHPLEGDIAKLDRLVAAGHRMIGLQHFFDNELGGSLHGESNAGLTEFGRAVVAEIARRPLILDLAHSSPAVAREVVEMTDIPLIVSHTGLHSQCAVKRNFPDDLMQAIVASGGVIGIGYWADAICDDSPTGVAATIAAAIRVLGEDHVSLGSDYDGSVRVSFDTSELAALTQALMAEGLSEVQIRKVMGENMLRVLRARLE